MELLLDTVRARYSTELGARLAAAHTIALQLGWCLFGDFLRASPVWRTLTIARSPVPSATPSIRFSTLRCKTSQANGPVTDSAAATSAPEEASATTASISGDRYRSVPGPATESRIAAITAAVA